PAGAEGNGFAGLLDAQVASQSVGAMLRWSLVFALTSSAAATVLAWLVAPYVAEPSREWWRAGLARAPIGLLRLVLLLSPVVTALGARVLAGAFEVNLNRTWAVLWLVHTLIALPVALRVLTSVYPNGAARSLIEASVLLGQSPRGATWRWRGLVALR